MISYILHDPAQGLSLFCMLILAISVHEMAHAWMAYRCGDDTAARMGRLTMNPLAHFDPVGLMFILMAPFGWGKPVPFNPYNLKNIKQDSMYIALAGPVSNMIQAGILAILWRLVYNDSFFALSHRFEMEAFFRGACLVLSAGMQINLILAFFNLIPLFPLDGEKILAGLLPYRQAQKLDELQKHSMGLLFLLLFSGFFLPISVLDIYFRLTAYPILSLLMG